MIGWAERWKESAMVWGRKGQRSGDPSRDGESSSEVMSSAQEMLVGGGRGRRRRKCGGWVCFQACRQLRGLSRVELLLLMALTCEYPLSFVVLLNVREGEGPVALGERPRRATNPCTLRGVLRWSWWIWLLIDEAAGDSLSRWSRVVGLGVQVRVRVLIIHHCQYSEGV